MCFPWIQKKSYSLTLESWIFFKHLQFKCLTVKSLYHKRYQRYVFSFYSLQKIHWQYFLDLFQQFFLYVLKSVCNRSCEIVILSQFQCDVLKKLIVHSWHLLLATQVLILTKHLFLRRNPFVYQYCFLYNLLL